MRVRRRSRVTSTKLGQHRGEQVRILHGRDHADNPRRQRDRHAHEAAEKRQYGRHSDDANDDEVECRHLLVTIAPLYPADLIFANASSAESRLEYAPTRTRCIDPWLVATGSTRALNPAAFNFAAISAAAATSASAATCTTYDPVASAGAAVLLTEVLAGLLAGLVAFAGTDFSEGAAGADFATGRIASGADGMIVGAGCPEHALLGGGHRARPGRVRNGRCRRRGCRCRCRRRLGLGPGCWRGIGRQRGNEFARIDRRNLDRYVVAERLWIALKQHRQDDRSSQCEHDRTHQAPTCSTLEFVDGGVGGVRMRGHDGLGT